MTNTPKKNWKKTYLIMNVGLILFFPVVSLVMALMFHLSIDKIIWPVGLIFIVLLLYVGPSLFVLPRLMHQPSILATLPGENYAVFKILNMTAIPLLLFGLSFFISHRWIMYLLIFYGLIFLLVSGILRAKALVSADQSNMK